MRNRLGHVSERKCDMTRRESVLPNLAEQASEAVLAANPFVRMPFSQIAAAAAAMVARFVADKRLRQATIARMKADLTDVLRGRSDIAPAEKDRRFVDEAWRSNGAYKRWMQAYLVVECQLKSLPSEAGLEGTRARRAEYVATLVADAIAPTNSLVGNPASLKRAFDTGGASLVAGFKNFVRDLRTNGGMPSMVDSSPFEVGVNLAATPGAVVYKTDLLELIQYAPVTPKVWRRPVLIVPPQVNRYYVLDLSPGRSMAEHLVATGHQTFMISWRNPTKADRAWDLTRYVLEAVEALQVVRRISRMQRINVLGACAGGVTTAAMLAYLAAREEDLVESITFLVTVLDFEADSAATVFADDAALAAAVRRSQRKGILAGADLARAFAWLRPNDLVWNYWVNNYLMGKQPPIFDVLAWNADNTNLPAGLHADFLNVFKTNGLANPGTLSVDGIPIDLGSIAMDSFFIGASTDHITPWPACYRGAGLVGGSSEFILSSSGHIQCLVNPPGNPKSSYLTNSALPDSHEAWLEAAESHQGSWWDYWVSWLSERAADERRAPAKLGNKRHPAGIPAPGTYVLQ